MKARFFVLALVAAALCFTGIARAETSVLLGSAQTSWANTATGAGGYGNLSAWKQTATATASTLTANYYFSAHTATQVVGVYSDNAGTPGTLLGTTTLPDGTGWKVATFTGVNVTAGTAYWVAQQQTALGVGTDNEYPVNEDCSGGVAYAFIQGQGSTMPSPWPSGSTIGSYCLHGFVVKG
jgi:hypothetical protein